MRSYTPITATSVTLSPMMNCYLSPTPASTSMRYTKCLALCADSDDVSFNGWGVTVIDSLDTMLIMGLEEEYMRAMPMIKATNFSLPSVCFFKVLCFAWPAHSHRIRMCLSLKPSSVIWAVSCPLTHFLVTTSCYTKQMNSQPSFHPPLIHAPDSPCLP